MINILNFLIKFLLSWLKIYKCFCIISCIYFVVKFEIFLFGNISNDE